MRRSVILALAVVALSGATATSVQADLTPIYVPFSYPVLQDGINAAQAGVNYVLVTDSDTYASIVMKSGVPVLAATGQTPTIDAGTSAAIAADWPSDATSATILDGFIIHGGTTTVARVRGSGVIRNCTVENEGQSGRIFGIVSTGSTLIQDDSVVMTGEGDYGIYHTGGAPQILDCEVSVADGQGIRVDCPSPTTTGSVAGCSVTMDTGRAFQLLTGQYAVSGATADFETADYYNVGFNCGTSVGYARFTLENSFASVPSGAGVYIYDDSVKVHNITVDNVGTGIVCHNLADVTVENCIVTNYNDGWEYAFENVKTAYCIADGNDPYDTGSQGTGSVIQDPLYCDLAGNQYTLRVDSYGNPENNTIGEQIGAYPVACMYGTLARDSE